MQQIFKLDNITNAILIDKYELKKLIIYLNGTLNEFSKSFY